MKRIRKGRKNVSAEAIARQAEQGKDVSRFFTNSGKMMEPIQRVNVDFTAAMLEELESAAKELNVSRQAVIKTFLRQALDHHYLAKSGRAGGEPVLRLLLHIYACQAGTQTMAAVVSLSQDPSLRSG